MPEELTVGEASREGMDLLWVLLASGPQCGFASLETIELRGHYQWLCKWQQPPLECVLWDLLCLYRS